ncbi:hypothetical protein V1477_001947 [Vespula maculifrons]|uniref:Uncharacterized protein n=1 Tax=Vespula maculifrons TaxID=7453 RepID=A0ABD2CXK2_VESMC
MYFNNAVQGGHRNGDHDDFEVEKWIQRYYVDQSSTRPHTLGPFTNSYPCWITHVYSSQRASESTLASARFEAKGQHWLPPQPPSPLPPVSASPPPPSLPLSPPLRYYHERTT